MSDSTQRTIAAVGLIVGGILGLVGSLVTSDTARSLCWGLDGIALVVATAILAVYYLRRQQDTLAAGFLVFLVGQGHVLSSARMELLASIAPFATGVSLWSAALFLICLPRYFALPIRVLGLISAVLFAVTALEVLAGHPLTALAQPLPFFAYPFFVATLLGIAWTLLMRTGGLKD